MTKKFKNPKMNWDTLCFKSFEHDNVFQNKFVLSVTPLFYSFILNLVNDVKIMI